MVGVVLLISATERLSDRAEESVIIESLQIIEQGNADRGLTLLENLADQKESVLAMRALARQYSDPNFEYYDIERALEYAEKLIYHDKSQEQVYKDVKAQALSDWQR